jgi:hypothetical protein
MRKDFVRGAIAVPAGVVLGLLGRRWEGWIISLYGLLLLFLEWKARDQQPIDPMLLADIGKARELENSDPKTANKLIDRAIEDADHREELELADLRRRASGDRRAAIELRSRLRGKLKIGQAARRKAEKWALNSPNGTAVLEEMDREAKTRQEQLAQVEQYLQNFRNQ